MKRNLKRILGCALVMVLVFALAACSMDAPGTESSAPAESSVPAESSAAPAASSDTGGAGAEKADGDITLSLIHISCKGL